MTPSQESVRTARPTWTYQATVHRVVDGDTVDLLVDVGFACAARVRIRVAGVNTPEVRGPERPQGLESKALVETWLPVGAAVIVRSYKGKRSFARWVGDIVFSHVARNGDVTQHDLAAALIDAGAGKAA